LADRSLAAFYGLAADHDGFLASTGEGRIVPVSGKEATLPDHVGANHILRVG